MVASLLHERRLVFVGSQLELLSSAVYAAATMLYPLCWQHIFLPLLPAGMMDYLTAPMPFIIGVPAAMSSLLQVNVPPSLSLADPSDAQAIGTVLVRSGPDLVRENDLPQLHRAHPQRRPTR